MRINLDYWAIETIHDEENNLVDVLVTDGENLIHAPGQSAYDIKQLVNFLQDELARLEE